MKSFIRHFQIAISGLVATTNHKNASRSLGGKTRPFEPLRSPPLSPATNAYLPASFTVGHFSRWLLEPPSRPCRFTRPALDRTLWCRTAKGKLKHTPRSRLLQTQPAKPESNNPPASSTARPTSKSINSRRPASSNSLDAPSPPTLAARRISAVRPPHVTGVCCLLRISKRGAGLRKSILQRG